MTDDPLGLAVQLIATIAAGMYPLGFLFGVCSDCCAPDLCPCSPLNEAYTLEVDITAETYFKSQVWERNDSFNCGGSDYASGTQFAFATLFPGDDLDGTWELDEVSSTANSTTFETTFGDEFEDRQSKLRVIAYGENPDCRQLKIELTLASRYRFVCDSTTVTESDLDCPSLYYPYGSAGLPGILNGCRFVGLLSETWIDCADHDPDDEPSVGITQFPIEATATVGSYQPPATDVDPFVAASLISESESGSLDVTITAVRAFM
jgi:hypothetical protein